MFEAKAIYSIEDLDYHQVPHKEGYVKGWLVNNFIVGNINYVDNDHELNVGFWCEVDVQTVEYLGLKDKY